MAPLSLYSISIPPMIKYLHNLSGFLTKASQHCVSKNIKPEEILQFRLIEDMLPLTYQVQSCSNTAKFLAHRVGDMPDIYLEDNETTFDELQARITRTIDMLSSLDSHCMDGKEEADIIMATARMGTFKFSGVDYVTKYTLPNFHFHLGTAYCILRHLGVPVGAFDYLDFQKDLFVKVPSEEKK